MRIVGIDFETYSERDIKSAGAYEYSADPSTEVICLFWKWQTESQVYGWGRLPLKQSIKTVYELGKPPASLDHERGLFFAGCSLLNRGLSKQEILAWGPIADEPEVFDRLSIAFESFPNAREIKKAEGYQPGDAYEVKTIKQTGYQTMTYGSVPLLKFLEEVVKPDVQISAFNCSFERAIWENVCHKKMWWPSLEELGEKKWIDTMAIAKAHTLPGNLKDCAKALKCEHQKDGDGNKAMLQISQPKKPSKADPHTRNWKTDKWKTVAKYCKQDVLTEQAILEKLLPLNKIGPQEQDIWELDMRINWEGVAIDRSTVIPSMDIIDEAHNRLNEELEKVTGIDDIKLTQREPILEFLADHGLNTQTLNKDFVETHKDDEDLEPEVRQVLQLKAAGGKSAVLKVPRMEDMSRSDGRCRNILAYYGASTGRWAGRGIQPQNLVKGSSLKGTYGVDPDNALNELCASLQTGDYDTVDMFWGNPLEAISTSIRSLIYCDDPSQKLIFSDYSSIESRGSAWLAGEQKLIDVFEAGDCAYKDMAGQIYGIKDPQSIEKKDPRRQVAKMAVLGLGYGMGATKFEESCQAAGIEIDLTFAKEVVDTYRKAYSEIPKSWWDLDAAAVQAVRSPGTEIECRQCLFWKKPGGVLFCQLPSGRRLIYYNAKIKQEKTPWGKMKPVVYYQGIDSQSPSRRWGWQKTYGGKLLENIVQAISRDIMADAMLRLDRMGHKILMTVHDEIVLQVDKSVTCKEIEEVMCVVPEWAAGFPIDAEAEEGMRYRK